MTVFILSSDWLNIIVNRIEDYTWRNNINIIEVLSETQDMQTIITPTSFEVLFIILLYNFFLFEIVIKRKYFYNKENISGQDHQIFFGKFNYLDLVLQIYPTFELINLIG